MNQDSRARSEASDSALCTSSRSRSCSVELQPSPLFRLPSSQSSCGNLRPSPHVAVQLPPAPRLHRAGWRAAVVGNQIAVVALLEAFWLRRHTSSRGRPTFARSPVQAKPCSSVAGCTATVTRAVGKSPSSRCSVLPAMMPSPHFFGDAAWCRSSGTASPSRRRHVEEQPFGPARRSCRRTSRCRRPCRRRT